MKLIEPGARLGMLGGGQLGRMFCFEAKRLGYQVEVFSPSAKGPAGQVADTEHVAPYEDEEALRKFVKGIDVLSLEFENIPSQALELASSLVPVHPSPEVLYITQNRGREKHFLRTQGLPVVPFKLVQKEADLGPALEELGFPAVLKTAGFGYDGKGQKRLSTLDEAKEAYRAFGQSEVIIEAFIDFKQEVSLIAARNQQGFKHFGLIENDHHKHILDVSVSPSFLPLSVHEQAEEIAHEVFTALNVIGVMCIEFFLTQNDQLLINELAPRPHNSGHLTIEAHAASQFEQQVRAVCGQPLGSTDLLRPAAMANLLGDLWQSPMPWSEVLAMPEVYLHLYGKEDARPGRKMGHITALGASSQEAKVLAKKARAYLE